MGEHKSFKKISKEGSWGTTGNITIEELQTGAILRIADSLEKIEKPISQAINELIWYKGKYQEQRQEIQILKNTIRKLKTSNTKLKNQNG
jgi:hypothetical protein